MKEKIATREDVFGIMDADLSKDEKREVMECEDVSDLHFSLGMYIRNRFFNDEELADGILDLFEDDNYTVMPDGLSLYIGSPDMWWEPIAEGYKEYLIKSLKKHK